MRFLPLMVAGIVFATAGTAAADEIHLAPQDRENLAVTVYQSGIGFVEDWRSTTLGSGSTRVGFEGVARRMIADSAAIAVAGARVSAIDYDFDVLSPATMLRASVGREVSVIRTHPTTGEDAVERATVLAAENGVVLRYRDRIETGVPGRLVFDSLPPGARPSPTLVATISAEAAGQRPLGLRYVTEGLAWRTDYVMTLDKDMAVLDLAGRAMLTNASGVDFEDARLALVAGDIRRVSSAHADAPKAALAMRAMAEAAPASTPRREGLGDVHLYAVDGTVTLADRQTKQIALLSAAAVPVTREYVSEAQAPVFGPARGEPVPVHTKIRLRFDNDRKAGPGEPLPAGNARMFVRDAGGSLRLIGEDRVRHTPVDGKVELSPGRAFDVTVTRRQTDFVRTGLPRNVSESAHEIEIANARTEPVTVRVVEIIPGDWRILEASVPHDSSRADRADWRISVPASGKEKLTYRVRVQR